MWSFILDVRFDDEVVIIKRTKQNVGQVICTFFKKSLNNVDAVEIWIRPLTLKKNSDIYSVGQIVELFEVKGKNVDRF